jgi:hypothetical protein
MFSTLKLLWLSHTQVLAYVVMNVFWFSNLSLCVYLLMVVNFQVFLVISLRKKRKMSSPFASMKWHVSDCQFIDSQRQTNKTFPPPPKEKKT